MVILSLVQHILFHVDLHLDDVILAVILQCWANIFCSTKQPVPGDFMDIKVLDKSKILKILRSITNIRQRFQVSPNLKNVTNWSFIPSFLFWIKVTLYVIFLKAKQINGHIMCHCYRFIAETGVFYLLQVIQNDWFLSDLFHIVRWTLDQDGSDKR